MLPFLRRHALTLSIILCLLSALAVFNLPPIEATTAGINEIAESPAPNPDWGWECSAGDLVGGTRASSRGVSRTDVTARPVSADASLAWEPEPQRQTVYITRTGAKYHRPSCQYLRYSSFPISLSEAKQRGYEPCKVCRPAR